MNVAPSSPPTATPAADSGAASGAQDKGATSGFDAILAEVGSQTSPAASDGKTTTKADDAANSDDKDVAEDTGEANAANPMLAALAVLLTPAPLADPTTATPGQTIAAVNAPVAAPALPETAPTAAFAQPNPDATAGLAAEAVVSAQTAASDVATAEPVAAPSLAVEATAAPAPKAERAARNEVAPATEANSRSVAQAVETETAAAVSAIATMPQGGDDGAANGDAQQQPQSPDPASAAIAPTQARAADQAAPPAETQVVRGSPDTVARLSADILKKLDGRSTRFDLALDPIGLGRVDVKVEIGANGHMTAALSFDNPQAVAELRNRSGELRSALQQAGFDLPDNALTFDLSSQGDGRNGAQTAWDFQERSQGQGAFASRAFEAALSGAESLISDLPPRYAAARGGVDVRI